MADDVVEHSTALPRSEGAPLVEPRPSREHPRVHRWRFAVAYVALAVVAGTAVGLAVMLIERPEEAAEPAWSEWQPVGHQASYPDQIADFVGGAYRHPSGRQLAGVIASEPRVVGQGDFVPLQAVYIQNESALPSASPDVDILPVGNTVMYILCGGGVQCALDEGEPSTERLTLLRREALELALYSFRYVEGTDSVIVVLPNDPGANAEDPADDTLLALFLQKRDFERELGRPLGQTLATATPQASSLQPGEARTIERLTDASLFQYQFEQAQTGGALMVLAPVNARP